MQVIYWKENLNVFNPNLSLNIILFEMGFYKNNKGVLIAPPSGKYLDEPKCLWHFDKKLGLRKFDIASGPKLFNPSRCNSILSYCYYY